MSISNPEAPWPKSAIIAALTTCLSGLRRHALTPSSFGMTSWDDLQVDEYIIGTAIRPTMAPEILIFPVAAIFRLQRVARGWLS